GDEAVREGPAAARAESGARAGRPGPPGRRALGQEAQRRPRAPAHPQGAGADGRQQDARRAAPGAELPRAPLQDPGLRPGVNASPAAPWPARPPTSTLDADPPGRRIAPWRRPMRHLILAA